MTRNPLNFGDVVGDHQVITRAGHVEAVVIPLEEYRALKALEQRILVSLTLISAALLPGTVPARLQCS